MVIANPYCTDEQIARARAMTPNTLRTEYSGTFLNKKEYKKIFKKHKWIKRVDKVNRRYLRSKLRKEMRKFRDQAYYAIESTWVLEDCGDAFSYLVEATERVMGEKK